MLLYIETKYRLHPVAKRIISHFPDAEILEIAHYKNLFDLHLAGPTKPAFILAGLGNALTPTPDHYGHQGKGFFFKNSLNCVYDCQYCYLKGAFRNDLKVLFVNYEDMAEQILQKREQIDANQTIWLYASDYSDNLALDHLTGFCEYFLPLIDALPNIKMEIRTKSANIKHLLTQSPAHNTEIAFSLSPQEIIDKYERKTPSLAHRLEAIKLLLDHNWHVGVRFLPLLEVPNALQIYGEFLDQVVETGLLQKVNSIFIGALLYTKGDYQKILKKEPFFDQLYRLKFENGYMRLSPDFREKIYTLFDQKLSQAGVCLRCLDEEK